MAAGRKPGCLIPAPSQPANTLVDLGEWTSSRMTEQGLSSSLRSGSQSTAKRFVPHVHFLLMEKVYRLFSLVPSCGRYGLFRIRMIFLAYSSPLPAYPAFAMPTIHACTSFGVRSWIGIA